MADLYNYIANYIDDLQAKGRYTFSTRDIENEFSIDYKAFRFALIRLAQKNRIIRAYQKFYVIVPAEYRNQGVLPPSLFIDDLMKHLGRPYYVGLLSAAALHGSGHQQPQQFQVMTTKPTSRPISIKNVKINFYFMDSIPDSGVMQTKTDTGYISLSNPALTAIDLIQYERRVGGLDRIFTVLDELSEKFQKDQFIQILKETFPVSVLQRLGYLLDRLLNQPDFADIIYQHIMARRIYRIALDPGSEKTGYSADSKWKVIVNQHLELEY